MLDTLRSHDLHVALICTLFLPLFALFVDYLIRYVTETAQQEELMRQAGPDCCILGIGSTGAVYVDQHVHSGGVFGSAPVAIFLILLLMGLRFACMLPNVRPTLKGKLLELRLGLVAIFLISSVITLAYIHAGVK